MRQSVYVNNLISFIERRLKGYAVEVSQAKGELYNIVITKKGEEPELFATIEFKAKDNKHKFADIRVKSRAAIKIISEFQIKFGMLADIPLAP